MMRFRTRLYRYRYQSNNRLTEKRNPKELFVVVNTRLEPNGREKVIFISFQYFSTV